MSHYLKHLSKRRTFLKTALALSTNVLLTNSLPSIASQTNDIYSEMEYELKQRAKFHMVFASPYINENAAYSPHMHLQLKNNIQDLSNGQIYVEVHDHGKLGVGTELMSSVSRGNISAALVSASNLSPIAPELDLLNIPFWSAQRQKYINLVTSQTWDNLVLKKIRMQGRIDVLFHHVTGARTATTTKGYGKTIKTPTDIAKVQFRIPASKSLGVFYQLAGATPIKARWKNVALLAKANRLNALDPSIIGLYNGPNNLKEHLGVISEIESVQDGWMTVVSQQWYQTLPSKLQTAIKEAADKTFTEHLENILQIEQTCQQELMALGTQLYQPTQDEKSQWIDCCGHQRQEWSPIKRALLGDEKLFAHLVEATQINNGFTL